MGVRRDERLVKALELAGAFENALRPRLLRRTSTVREEAVTFLGLLDDLSDVELVALDRRARPW